MAQCFAGGRVGMVSGTLILKQPVGRSYDVFDFGTGLRFQKWQGIDEHPLVGDQLGSLLEFGQCSTGGPSGTGDQGRREASTSITLNPSNQTIPQGQNASFNVVATGGSLAYQWQRNNVNLPADPRYTGINSPTLGISNAQTGDQGTYRCVVTGFCGAAQNSGGATLTVTTGPTCDGIDFNNDSSLFDPVDIDAFLSVYGEGPCIPSGATCNDIDFNNDGSVFDPCDIDSFLLVFSEGPCTPCGV